MRTSRRLLTMPANIDQALESLDKPASSVTLGSYRDTHAQIDRELDLLDRAAAMPFTQARAALAPAIAEYKQAHDEAEKALALARAVYDAVLARLPEEVRP